ncbi:MAG: hypothetical protein V4649_16340 [Bacteroidota bacterium]
MESPLATMARTMPYSVPKGYFSGLTADIYNTVSQLQATTDSDRKQVPEGYFETLPEQMLLAAKQADKKKPVLQPLFRQVRWAAAAILIVCIGIGSYMTFDNAYPANAETMLASVSQNEITDYLQDIERVEAENISDDVALGSAQLDNDAIVEYLNETGWE